MEVKVITRRGGEYIFTQKDDGEWTLLRHGRTFYRLKGTIRIHKYMPMKFVACRYYPLLDEYGPAIELQSSMVAKIWIGGDSVRKIVINAGKLPT